MFADLHTPGDPLLLPNAWDHASAAALVDAGFKAIGTTSLGVAAAIGVPDGANATKQATLELAERLVHLPVPISVDAEHGFSEDPTRGRRVRAATRGARRRRHQPRGPQRRPEAPRRA